MQFCYMYQNMQTTGKLYHNWKTFNHTSLIQLQTLQTTGIKTTTANILKRTTCVYTTTANTSNHMPHHNITDQTGSMCDRPIKRRAGIGIQSKLSSKLNLPIWTLSASNAYREKFSSLILSITGHTTCVLFSAILPNKGGNQPKIRITKGDNSFTSII